MHLDIKTRTGLRVINLDKTFFTPTQVVSRGVIKIMSPQQKARDIAEDLGGKNLVNYSLYQDQKLLSEGDGPAKSVPTLALPTRRNV